MTAFQTAMSNEFDEQFGPLQLSNPTPSTTPPTWSNSLAKKKRNQKKNKTWTQGLQITVEELDHMQEVEHAVENEASKHLVLHRKAP